MNGLKAVLLILGIPCLYGVLAFVGSVLAGAGHGSDYFGAVCLAPFSAVSESAWVLIASEAFWVLVAVLIAMRRFQACRLAAAVVLLFHYVAIVIMSLQREDWPYVAQVWHSCGGLVLLLAAFYFWSQAMMWGLIVWRRDVA